MVYPIGNQIVFKRQQNIANKWAKELGKLKGVPSINIALAYVLDQPFDVAAIVGSRNKSEFDSCAEALKIRLTPAEIDYLCLKTDKL